MTPRATWFLTCLVLIRGAENPSPPTASPGSVIVTAPMQASRAAHSATLLPGGLVLVVGGMEHDGRYFASTEFFSSTPDRWSAGPDLATARAGHQAIPLAGGRVLILGGDGSSGPLASAEMYDPAANRFVAAGAMLEARDDFTATLLPSGKVLIVGGENRGALASAELYDPVVGRSRRTGSMHAARGQHTATLLADGRVLIVGGGEYQRPLASAETFDPATDQFEAAGDMAFPRYKHAAVRLADGTVLILGGSSGGDWRGILTDAVRYDPMRKAFSPAGQMDFPRFKLGSAVVTLSDGRILVAGGAMQVEAYDPPSSSFHRVAGQLDGARFFSTATALPDRRALIVGGYDGQGNSGARAWLFRPREQATRGGVN